MGKVNKNTIRTGKIQTLDKIARMGIIKQEGIVDTDCSSNNSIGSGTLALFEESDLHRILFADLNEGMDVHYTTASEEAGQGFELVTRLMKPELIEEIEASLSLGQKAGKVVFYDCETGIGSIRTAGGIAVAFSEKPLNSDSITVGNTVTYEDKGIDSKRLASKVINDAWLTGTVTFIAHLSSDPIDSTFNFGKIDNVVRFTVDNYSPKPNFEFLSDGSDGRPASIVSYKVDSSKMRATHVR